MDSSGESRATIVKDRPGLVKINLREPRGREAINSRRIRQSYLRAGFRRARPPEGKDIGARLAGRGRRAAPAASFVGVLNWPTSPRFRLPQFETPMGSGISSSQNLAPRLAKIRRVGLARRAAIRIQPYPSNQFPHEAPIND